ncbi:MAG: HNH endonuclease [Bdellovibrionales bacterium]|nr:HNH endonuclease [Bdellovibrionales bacterium]
MDLSKLKDAELLNQTQKLVEQERELLTQVLHHLCEVDRRKLYCDLGYSSLFDYAVKELHYSEGQAGRRIQTMRLIKEIPEVENKIATGRLSLTNIAQAQSYFREASVKAPQKRQLLNQLENKSTREGQKLLLSLQPQGSLPKEKARQITVQHTEVRMVIDESLKNKLTQLRSLLGVKAISMNLVQLIECMADMSIESLQIKKFGKKNLVPPATKATRKRTALGNSTTASSAKPYRANANANANSHTNINLHAHASTGVNTNAHLNHPQQNTLIPAQELHCANDIPQGQNFNLVPQEIYEKNILHNNHPQQNTFTPAPESNYQTQNKKYKNTRYINASLKHHVWYRDKGQCQNCGTTHNLQYDHIEPLAQKGETSIENLRLLCFACNQRQAIKTYGLNFMERKINQKNEELIVEKTVAS